MGMFEGRYLCKCYIEKYMFYVPVCGIDVLHMDLLRSIGMRLWIRIIERCVLVLELEIAWERFCQPCPHQRLYTYT
jgi:hypothetical protein